MNEGRWKIKPNDFVNYNKIGLGKLEILEFDWVQSSSHSQIPFSLMTHSHSRTIYGSPSMGLKHNFLKFISLPKLKESQSKQPQFSELGLITNCSNPNSLNYYHRHAKPSFHKNLNVHQKSHVGKIYLSLHCLTIKAMTVKNLLTMLVTWANKMWPEEGGWWSKVKVILSGGDLPTRCWNIKWKPLICFLDFPIVLS
jgi:hypothetical protein